MNNDLISRRALKKAWQNREECVECTDTACIYCFYESIDNAPTVDCSDELSEMAFSHALTVEERQDLTRAYLIGRRAEQRPQGKWIEDSGNIACSQCHTIWLYRRTDYCPNCGSRMENPDNE